jgi:hypothetical protein
MKAHSVILNLYLRDFPFNPFSLLLYSTKGIMHP